MGYLELMADRELAEESASLLIRFAKVFDQSYTRFLDLQKAEAQAREARVEAALERVRAQAMAMRHSDDLVQSTTIVFEELEKLDLSIGRSGIGIFNAKTRDCELWTTVVGKDGEKELATGITSLTVHPMLIATFEAWKAQKPLSYILEGNELADYYKIVSKSDFVLSEDVIGKSASLEREFYHYTPFGAGGLYFFSESEPTPEDKMIIRRFAEVFDMTYTRFLDLQKAEAQAREAQIEAALERVRSRSMAMHSSEELAEVATVLYNELLKLQVIEFTVASIVVFDEPNNQQIVWGSQTESEALEKSIMPLLGDEVLQEIYDKWLSGEALFSVKVGGVAFENHKNFVFPIAERTELVDRFLKNMPDPTFFHCAVYSMGYLELVSDRELPDESAFLLKRFAKVFEQTYTRFLDLQRAEKQAREARIEMALERVRAGMMAMHKSDELRLVIKTIFEQLQELDFGADASAVIIYDENYAAEHWFSGYSYQTYPKSYTIPYIEKFAYNTDLVDAWKKGVTFQAFPMEGTEKTDYGHWLLENTDFKDLPEEFTIHAITPDRLVLNDAFNKYGMLEVLGPEELAPENAEILNRFSKVFEQTYTRFLDLKKAEAQAREAQIETALERVRSRTMAMQHSDELAEASHLLDREVRGLGIKTWGCAFNIYRENDSIEWFGNEAGLLPTYPVPREGIFKEYFEGRQRGETLLVKEIAGDACIAHYEYMSTLPVVGEVLRQLKETNGSFPSYQIDHVAYFKYGYLLFITREAVPEAHDIFKRFAKVFEQTYTRFLDLKKAEAQAREARIETALERVRSRTMGMQTSDELREVVLVINEQLHRLDFGSNACNIIILDKETGNSTYWVSGFTKDIYPVSYHVPYLDHPYYEALLNPWKQGERYVVYEYSGQDKKDFEKISFAKTGFKNVPAEAKKVMRSLPYVILSTAYFSNGALQVIGPEALSEEKALILQRFAKVFDQTYTRFLDLKKAEAQAREAQIETALERVRSRSMAMQTSEELKEVIRVIFDQLALLNIHAEHAGIVVDYSPGQDWNFWVADNQDIPSRINVPYLDLPWDRQFTEAKKNGTDFFTMQLNFEEKNSFYQKLLPHIPGVTQEAMDFYFSCPGLAASTVLQEDVALYIENFSGTPYSEEDNSILSRFGKVFQQTYTRFLDLKKVEAQAREARIETALERVRARALAMQQPEELKEVAQVLRGEMGLLGVEELETCSIYINDEETRKAECWYAIKDIREQQKVMVADHFTLDLQDTWVGREMLQFYESASEQVSIVMKGKQRREWIAYCEAQSEPLKGYYGEEIPDRTYHLYKFSHGAIGVATDGDLSEESWRLLRRAASVFSLAYSRFRDLTQARLDLQRLKEEKKRAEDALAELQLTQKQLVHAEKMASLGELTAGIAHEIQNPLNFVNNFSEVSRDAIAKDVIQNLEKIVHHGKRADGIVKGMLQHSRSSDGKKEPTDLNRLADEYLRLAYHGLRAKDKLFNATLETEFDPDLPLMEVIPQDIGRVMLNLLTNAFHAVSEKTQQAQEDFEPIVTVRTRKTPDGVEIAVIDNGNGIPEHIREKIFQPFFTTKPTGEGTGLGLSMSYDIVTKGHGGDLKVASKVQEGTEFIVTLPV